MCLFSSSLHIVVGFTFFPRHVESCTTQLDLSFLSKPPITLEFYKHLGIFIVNSHVDMDKMV